MGVDADGIDDCASHDAVADGAPFHVRLIKRDGVSLGMSITRALEEDALHIDSVLENGLVEFWNQQREEEHRVRAGDRIVSVNAAEGDFDKMLGELGWPGKQLLKVIRGPFPSPSLACHPKPPAPPQPASASSAASLEQSRLSEASLEQSTLPGINPQPTQPKRPADL